MQVNCTDQVVDFLGRLQLLANAELELLEKVDYTGLDQLVILEVARVTVLELLQVNLFLVVFEADVQQKAAHVADLCPRESELLLVEDRVDELVFLDTSIEAFRLVLKQVFASEIIEIFSRSHLFEEFPHRVQEGVVPQVVVLLRR